MRTITDAQKQALEDLSAQGLLRGHPFQTAETDIHITELPKGLSKLQVHHDLFSDLEKSKEPTRHDAGIPLVFAGGTCLSKAHAEKLERCLEARFCNGETGICKGKVKFSSSTTNPYKSKTYTTQFNGSSKHRHRWQH